MPIFHRIYEFYKLFYQYSKNLPKKDRYTIGQKCENLILEIIVLFFYSSQLPKIKKLELLREASIKLDLLKILIRILKDLKILNNSKYLQLENELQEIGRMLGGWIRSLK